MVIRASDACLGAGGLRTVISDVEGGTTRGHPHPSRGGSRRARTEQTHADALICSDHLKEDGLWIRGKWYGRKQR